MAPTPTPYKISIPDSSLSTLHTKLSAATFPSPLDPALTDSWAYGAPLSEVKRLAEYWLNAFDWRKAEALLNNTLPQFTTAVGVDGFGDYDIHFVHIRSKVGNAIPLLFLHGWPGSFYEVSKIAQPLANRNGTSEPAFHVVAPSLVDHGFSSGSRTVSCLQLLLK